MDIREEYEWLKLVFADPRVYREFDNECKDAAGMTRLPNGGVYTSGTTGSGVCGFAIDPVTHIYEIGMMGCAHDLPQSNVRNEVLEITGDWESRHRIVSGRLFFVEGWGYPIIDLSGVTAKLTPETLAELEEWILENKIGLPVSRLGIAQSRSAPPGWK